VRSGYPAESEHKIYVSNLHFVKEYFVFKSSTAARVALKATPLFGCAVIALTTATFAAPALRGPVRTAPRPALAHRAAGSGVTLYGGGATLPALAYEGMQAETKNPGQSPFAAGTVFGSLLNRADKGDSLQYCQTGSGYGKGVLNGLDPANGACAALNASPTGFGVPSGAQAYADFSGSDSPVSQSDYSALQTGPLSARGEFVQVPYIAGAVAIFYNNSSLDNASQLSITPKTLCEIADGEITNWNKIPVNPNEPNGKKYPAKTLTWVYRYDGSGTTFSFGNYLSASNVGNTGPAHCTAAENYGLSQVFDANNNSKGSSGGYGVLPNNDAEKANFLAGSGNPGVVACILATPGAQCYNSDTLVPAVGDGSIGYVEAANASASRNNAAGQNYAEIFLHTGSGTKAYDPIKDLPEAAAQIQTVNVNEVVAAALPAGRPSPDVVGVSGSTGNCLGIVDPASYDNIKTGYPIVAVTNLEFTSAGNGVKAPDLQNLATFADATNFPKSGITSVDPSKAKTGKTGYSEINLPVNAITTLASCIGN
jgi:phosphate transport system substrate-binding protein